MWATWKHHVTAVGILLAAGLWTVLIPPRPGDTRPFPFLMPEQAPGALGTRFFGYGALVLLGLALAIGPLARLRPGWFARWIPYRRAIGIWSALSGAVHLLFVLQMLTFDFYRQMYGPSWYHLFVRTMTVVDSNGESFTRYFLRADVTSWVAWTGLLALLLLLVVAAVSNDWAQKLLGQSAWKLVQQWSYSAFLFVALHLLLMKYGAKLKVSPPLTRWALWLLLAVALLQAAGFVYTVWRRERRR
ncbi:MAG: hypothetical protein ACOY93_10060 [Bacillota bacterium]